MNRTPQRRYVLTHWKGLGDVVLLTALVRDIKLAYGDDVQLSVRTTAGNLWENNPYLSPLKRNSPGVRTIEISYRNALGRAGRGAREHFLCAYYDDFEQKTGLQVPMTRPGGDLHLSEDECQPWISGPYWVVIAGGYNNITTKQWPYSRYQEVVDRLRQLGIHCVQAGSTDAGHVHPPLNGVLNLVGQTDHRRDLLTLLYHARGVICGITGAMHIAAAFDRPCVVIGGARESKEFVAYDREAQFRPGCPPVAVPHVFLHSLGQLPCGPTHGCWRKRTVPIEQKDLGKDFVRLCRRPVERADGWFPACMELISTDSVVDAVMSYYRDGTLDISELNDPESRRPPRLLRPPQRVKPPKPANLVQPRPLTNGVTKNRSWS